MNTSARPRFTVRLVIVLGAFLVLGLSMGFPFYMRRRSLAGYRQDIAQERSEWVQEQLAGLRSGRQSEIGFSWTSDTDDLLSHFRGMPEVEELSLELTDVSREGLKDVRSLPNLHNLTILCSAVRGRPRVDDTGLEELRGHPKLETLELHNTNVTDGGLAVLATLPNLKHLTLYRESFRPTTLTDRALEHLQSLQHLKVLWVSGGWISNQAVGELRKALPNCRINELPAKPRADSD